MGITLGLDIGIGSVGFGVIDGDCGKVLEAGARLFSSTNPEENVTRRNMRQARRLNRRKKHRLERVYELFEKNGLSENIEVDNNPYALRVKGLQEKLEISELYVALYNIAKHRGISYLEDVDDVGSDVLKRNTDLLAQQHPCEIQLQRFETYGKVRGTFDILNESGEVETVINVFPTSAYRREAEIILKKQQEYYAQISDAFIEQYIIILTSKREYYVGPGNELSRTDYGIYRTNGYTLTNLFDILIGKCSVYPVERRASGSSYTAQLFNFLNDLNNITVAGEKLTPSQKRDIYEIVNDLNKKSVNIMQIIAKVSGCHKEEITGFRIDKKGKPEFHTFEVHRKFRKYMLNTVCFDVLTWESEQYDQVMGILTLNTEVSAIKKELKEKLVFSEEMIAHVADFRKENSTLFSKWHNLSLKAMNEIMDDLWETDKNQMQLFT